MLNVDMCGYRPVTVLGQGGMAIVYLGESDDGNDYVALKVIRDLRFRRQFAREGRIAQRLSTLRHPNVVQFLGRGDGFIVTELLVGTTLDQFLNASHTLLSKEAVIRLVLDIAYGLDAIHEAGVIHRDLKPTNIFLTQTEGEPDSWPAKLIDFGIAKIIDPDEAREDDEATDPGIVLGTPSHMSPEQAIGASLDVRTDLYSLGCILYFLLTGQYLHDAKEPAGVFKIRQLNPVPPMPTEGIEVDPELWALMIKLVEIDADRRPASAAAVIGELELILSNSIIEATVTQVPQEVEITASEAPAPTAKHPRRTSSNREALLIGLGSMVCTLLIAGSVLGIVRYLPSPQPVVAHEPAPRSVAHRITQARHVSPRDEVPPPAMQPVPTPSELVVDLGVPLTQVERTPRQRYEDFQIPADERWPRIAKHRRERLCGHYARHRFTSPRFVRFCTGFLVKPLPLPAP